MAQTEIENRTACAAETLFSNNERFQPIVTPIVKASYFIGQDGSLEFAYDQQVPVDLKGEFVGDPENSSYIYEPECAFIKPSTDVVIIGDAVSPRGAVPELDVTIEVGSLRKHLKIFGDRYWVPNATCYYATEPDNFERLPIIWENAFGGWDRRNPQNPQFEARNPVGKGFYIAENDPGDAPLPLPNIEDPRQLIRKISDRPQPAGSGYTLPQWQPRAAYAGTYDQAWEQHLSPRLPKDFDRRFFNGASPGLIAPDYLRGDEPVVIRNMTEDGLLSFYLPGVRPPQCSITLRHARHTVNLFLDTVIISTNTRLLELIWRNYLPLARGPHDVERIEIQYG